jgi:hypothetical protein
VFVGFRFSRPSQQRIGLDSGPNARKRIVRNRQDNMRRFCCVFWLTGLVFLHFLARFFFLTRNHGRDWNVFLDFRIESSRSPAKNAKRFLHLLVPTPGIGPALLLTFSFSGAFSMSSSMSSSSAASAFDLDRVRVTSRTYNYFSDVSDAVK